MKKVGITGGMGSGKSTVCRVFKTLGVPVFDADTEAKNVMTVDPLLVTQLKESFGADIYAEDGSLKRQLLASRVFNDEAALRKLNSLVHPAVFRAYKEWQKKHEHFPYIVKEAALLFESGADQLNDVNILVSAPEELRISRVMQRDGMSRADILSRMQKQMPEEEKIRRADALILNDESTLLLPQILKLHEQFSR